MAEVSEHPSVLDPSALDQLRALQRPGKPSLVDKVIELFMQDAPAHLAGFRAAAEALDTVEMRRRVHTLKSSSASVGAMALSRACADAEEAARLGDREEALRRAEPLDGMLEQVLEALREELAA